MESLAIESLGFRLVQFMSATQPRDEVHSTGVKGNLDGKSQTTKDSLRIRDMLTNTRSGGGLHYTQSKVWNWLAHVPGLDITAVFHGDTCVGATIGYYSESQHAYLTHLTAVRLELQGGSGIGPYLRRKQLYWLSLIHI